MQLLHALDAGLGRWLGWRHRRGGAGRVRAGGAAAPGCSGFGRLFTLIAEGEESGEDDELKAFAVVYVESVRRSGERNGETVECGPVEVVVEQLDGGGLVPSGLFRDSNEHLFCRISTRV
jgi:hypothetical protein